MSNQQLLDLFKEFGLDKKDKEFLSHPMNTRHEAMFKAFKRGLLVGEQL